MKPVVTDMTHELLGRFVVMKALAEQAGHIYGKDWALTCVLRTEPEQIALYSQGRDPLAVVNEYRRSAGMAPISNSENQYKVTWTLKSKHFADELGKSRAFDFVVQKNGRLACWDTKWDGDKDNVSDYLEIAQFAKAAGLESGIYWEKADPPHVQLPVGI